MTNDFQVGDHVGWNAEAGHVLGPIMKKVTLAITFKTYTVRASMEKPQYLIKSVTTTPPGHALAISAQDT